MSEDKFVFTADSQKKLLIAKLAGLALVVVGILFIAFGGHGHEEGAAAGHHYHWLHRVWVNLWINNVYFIGISLTGILFLALQYASQAGWSAYIKRIPEAFGGWLVFGFGLTLITMLNETFQLIDNTKIISPICKSYSWTHKNVKF